MTEQDQNAEASLPEETPETEEQSPEVSAPEPDVAAEMREKWLRAEAEMQNMRKRAAGQTQAALQRQRNEMLLSFLGVLDSLESALSKHEGEHNDWVEGTQAVFRQMLKIFKDYNVEPFDSLGQAFDPNLHEAMGQIPLPGQPAGLVIEVLQPGYRFTDGNLLRAARVLVSA